ncbi:MAG TPA: hypothetical protein VFB58_14075 [Chloroflexota bacterium]|nr:hypothetical protein [Chloroflexota bacterium]
MHSVTRHVATIQGIYFLVTGLWPLISSRTFQMITGPKVDLWVVKATGLLIAVIGTVLLRSRPPSREIALLGALSAASLGAIDTWYAVKGRISRIYLADAAAEALFIAGWKDRL